MRKRRLGETLCSTIGIFQIGYRFGWTLFEVSLWIKNRREGKTSKAAPRKIRTGSDYTFGIIYSVLCALIWSLSYVTLSYLTPRVGLLEMNVALLGFAFVFLLIGSGLASQWKDPEISLLTIHVNWASLTPWIVAAANIASFLLFISALNFISASQTITLQKVNPIFVAICTWVWLQRTPSRSTLLTVFLVVSGTSLLQQTNNSGLVEEKRLRARYAHCWPASRSRFLVSELRGRATRQWVGRSSPVLSNDLSHLLYNHHLDSLLQPKRDLFRIAKC